MAQYSTGGPLSFQAGPLVWIDCEMTGLNPKKDKLLEIAVLITNGNLDLVDDGIQFVIRTEKTHLDSMDEWCTTQHGKPYSKDYVSSTVLQYIKKWVPERRTGLLAGSSVHADLSFLVEEMPEVKQDVSSIKELCRRWYPGIGAPKKIFTGNHRALEDIKTSMKELAWYRDNIFRDPGEVANRRTSPSHD
ncbi:ribonuclease H-like domain-containing protein [Melanogaster broomeanus]|nr:ribonuclease H-like domain-containing protein [Melanogaster broomeanus]